eukprot:scaffold624_cov402-Prasinococcus_capsulatus_cf.AAC.18
MGSLPPNRPDGRPHPRPVDPPVATALHTYVYIHDVHVGEGQLRWRPRASEARHTRTCSTCACRILPACGSLPVRVSVQGRIISCAGSAPACGSSSSICGRRPPPQAAAASAAAIAAAAAAAEPKAAHAAPESVCRPGRGTRRRRPACGRGGKGAGVAPPLLHGPSCCAGAPCDRTCPGS